MAEQGTYERPKDGWCCFHCGEVFMTVGAAQDHFGVGPGYEPGCVLKVKLGDERGWLLELRKAEQRADEQLERALQAERELEAAQCQIDSLSTAMRGYKPFRECRGMSDVFNVYDFMEGLKLAAEDRERRLVDLIGQNGFIVMQRDEDGSLFLKKPNWIDQDYSRFMPAPAEN